ncbi:MAG: hypothetical protein F7C08_02270 [Desulfurococcales archaeon]|nr:hypothetical protein [Desulfurococcales archaeon]MCE4605344.1 hypothetical protein [Desulfurococcales archaeon]
MGARSLLSREIEEPASFPIALAAITLAIGGDNVLEPRFYASGYFAGILAGFILHELAHRQVARRYGMHAEFIAYPPGLLITLASVLLPIIILAPGYVRTYTFYGYNPRGFINSVAAGPAVNIVLALLGMTYHATTGSPWAWQFSWVNGLIAVFNLLPVPPLDGDKILRSNTRLWAAMFIAAAAIYLAV